MVAFLVDVEPGHLGLEGDELGAPAREHDVGLALLEHAVPLAGRYLVEEQGIGAEQLAGAGLVLLGGFAHRGADHPHPHFLQGRDHRPGFDAAGVKQHLLALEGGAELGQTRPGAGLFLGDQRLGAGHQVGRGAGLDQHARDGAQRLGRVADAVEAALEIGNAPPLFHLARQTDQGLGADHHVELGAVGGTDVGKAAVAGDRREDTNADAFEKGLYLPQLAGDIVLAEHVDVARAGGGGLAGADDVIEQRLAAQFVAEVLGAGETGRVDGNHRLAEIFGGAGANLDQVVADQRRNTGLVNEDGGRVEALDNFADGAIELLFSAVDDVEFLQIGGHADAIQHRAGAETVPAIP